MSYMDPLTTFTIITGILGVVGGSAIVGGARRSSELIRTSRILRFARSSSLDVVITTRPNQPANSYGTSVGEVQAIASVAGALGKFYRRKRLTVHMSKAINRRLNNDVLVLGSPFYNSRSDIYIKAFNERYPNAGIALDFSTGTALLGSDGYRSFDVGRGEDASRQTNDVFMILLATNLFSENTRAILCAGLTTYGTAAAAETLFVDLLSRPARKVAKPLRTADGAAVIGDVTIVDRRLTDINIRYMKTYPAQISNSGSVG